MLARKCCFKQANGPENSYLLNVCYFVDVDESIFNDVESPIERIFYILRIRKSFLDEVAEVMFK
jgi:hypothetical protein